MTSNSSRQELFLWRDVFTGNLPRKKCGVVSYNLNWMKDLHKNASETHLAWRRKAGCSAEEPGAPYSSSPGCPRPSCSSSRSPWGWSGSPWWCWPCSQARWGEETRGIAVTWEISLISQAKYRWRRFVKGSLCPRRNYWCNLLGLIPIS